MEEFFINLAGNPFLAYVLLFLGSFGDALIGVNMFVYGEPFFLVGSYMASLNLLNISLVYFVLVFGAFVGDTLSYLIGRKYSVYLFEKKKIISQEKLEKGGKFFEKYGAKSILLSKFLGPVAWVVPFLAGSLRYNYKTFLPYNLLGSILGIGQFILVGYFGFQYFHPSPYVFVFVLFCITLYIIYVNYKKKI